MEAIIVSMETIVKRRPFFGLNKRRCNLAGRDSGFTPNRRVLNPAPLSLETRIALLSAIELNFRIVRYSSTIEDAGQQHFVRLPIIPVCLPALLLRYPMRELDPPGRRA